MIKKIIQKIKTLFGKKEIVEVKEGTELYSLVQDKMYQLDLAALNSKIENLEKVLYFVLTAINSITDITNSNKNLLADQIAINEEMLFAFEQIMKKVQHQEVSGESATEIDKLIEHANIHKKSSKNGMN